MNRQCYTCSRISSGSCTHCLINGGRYNNYKEKKTLSYVDFIPLFIDSSPGSTPEEKYDFACGLAKKHIETIEFERRKLIEADMLEKEQKEKLRISEVEEYIEKYNACAAEIFPSLNKYYLDCIRIYEEWKRLKKIENVLNYDCRRMKSSMYLLEGCDDIKFSDSTSGFPSVKYEAVLNCLQGIFTKKDITLYHGVEAKSKITYSMFADFFQDIDKRIEYKYGKQNELEAQLINSFPYGPKFPEFTFNGKSYVCHGSPSYNMDFFSLVHEFFDLEHPSFGISEDELDLLKPTDFKVA